jgi:quinol-cytochrome oxidoreductase complex cytochrome b subunit
MSSEVRTVTVTDPTLAPGETRAERSNRMRATANNAILHLHPPRVPAAALRFTYTWGLGGISALLAALLAMTGVLLMFRYEPSVERAYASILLLESEVMFGALVRAVHHWSGNLLAITAFLHLVRVFFSGGFKQGRFVNWLVGIALLLFVLFFNFTGYLLPWDQLAYWAVTVVTSLLAYIPLLGQAISRLVLGGNEVGQGALNNFYALHVAVLPAVTVIALAYHFWKVRKDGGISQPIPPDDQPVERVTTIPNLVNIELSVAAIVLTTLVLFAMFVPAPLEELANPLHPPNPDKAAWYFAGVQELLLHMHALAAMALVLIVLVGLALLPRWDRHERTVGVYFRSATGRRAALAAGLLALYLVPVLVVADEYWIDWLALLPGWPLLVTTGLVPLLLTLVGLALVYLGLRKVLRADHSEALLGLFTFVLVGLIVLTIVGVFFRGQNMALVLPF